MPPDDLGSAEAAKRFMMAIRMWISAVWRSGFLAAMRSPKAFQPHNFASIPLRTGYPAQRFQNVRLEYRVAREVLFLALAAGQSSFYKR